MHTWGVHIYTSIYAWPLLCLSVALADYDLWDVSLVKLFSSSSVIYVKEFHFCTTKTAVCFSIIYAVMHVCTVIPPVYSSYIYVLVYILYYIMH